MADGAGVRPRRLVGDAGKWGNGDEGMCTDKDSGRRWGKNAIRSRLSLGGTGGEMSSEVRGAGDREKIYIQMIME